MSTLTVKNVKDSCIPFMTRRVRRNMLNVPLVGTQLGMIDGLVPLLQSPTVVRHWTPYIPCIESNHPRRSKYPRIVMMWFCMRLGSFWWLVFPFFSRYFSLSFCAFGVSGFSAMNLRCTVVRWAGSTHTSASNILRNRSEWPSFSGRLPWISSCATTAWRLVGIPALK